MTYQIIYSRRARQDIEKLDRVTKRKLKRAIERFSQKPLFYARKMVSSRVGQHRWRAGNYRIIFDISGKRIEVLRVGHRREVYRR